MNILSDDEILNKYKTDLEFHNKIDNFQKRQKENTVLRLPDGGIRIIVKDLYIFKDGNSRMIINSRSFY